MFEWCLIIILVTTILMSMIGVRTSLLAIGTATLLANRNFSFVSTIVRRFTWFRFRIVIFQFKIRSVWSLTFSIRTIGSVILLSRRWWFVFSDLSELLFLSYGLAKDGKSRPSCLECWFRYCKIALSGLYGSKFLQYLFIEFSIGETFDFVHFLNCQVLSLEQ
jgi:hypothetical protein